MSFRHRQGQRLLQNLTFCVVAYGAKLGAWTRQQGRPPPDWQYKICWPQSLLGINWGLYASVFSSTEQLYSSVAREKSCNAVWMIIERKNKTKQVFSLIKMWHVSSSKCEWRTTQQSVAVTTRCKSHSEKVHLTESKISNACIIVPYLILFLFVLRITAM